MDHVEASTVLYLPPDEVYELLFDFTRYPRYTDHVEDVTIRGEGAGTRFDLTFSWWKLTHTFRGRVTDVDPPERIEFELVDGLAVEGYWSIEELDRSPPDRETATRARLHLAFDRERSRVRGLRLPPGVSVEWILRRVKPLVRREGKRLTRRVVEDVEGRPRRVELEVHAGPETI